MCNRTEVAVWAARLILPLLMVIAVRAQTTVSLKPGATIPGQVSLAVSLDSAAAGVSAIQWRIVLPPGWTAQQVAGSASTSANKKLYCTQDFSACLVAGLNTSAISPGTLSNIAITVPASNVNTSASLQLSSLAAVTDAGSDAPVATATAAFTVSLPTKCDANGDGVIDDKDLAILVIAILIGDSKGPDLNGDGKVDRFDLAPLVNAFQKGVCQ